MTAKQKQVAEDAVFERVMERIHRTTREEWLNILESYPSEKQDASATEPVAQPLDSRLSATGRTIPKS